jgi:hypothetical protein
VNKETPISRLSFERIEDEEESKKKFKGKAIFENKIGKERKYCISEKD